MSKPNKIPSIPTIYHKVTREASRQHHCICEDIHGQWFRHDNPGAINVIKEAQAKVWKNFEAFLLENDQTILAYHANLYQAEPPKGQDRVTTGLYTWFALCDTAIDRTTKTPRSTEGRKMTIGNRNYFLGESKDTSLIKTPQARVCYQIVTQSLDIKTKKDTEKMPPELKAKYVPSITEEELRQIIINRAGELHTRQDPWRIFQYYRPALIAALLLKHD